MRGMWAQVVMGSAALAMLNDAVKKGYSGTALYSKVKPERVTTRLGWEPVDSEGRYIQADYKGLVDRSRIPLHWAG